jgi:hypothetical protein
LDRHPPVRAIQNVVSADLHPRNRESTRFLIAHTARRQYFDHGCRRRAAIQYDIGDDGPVEADLRCSVGNVVGNVLDNTAVAVVARAGPRDARPRAAPGLPFLDDPQKLALRRTMERALAGAAFTTTMSEVRTPSLAASKDDVRTAARAAIRLIRGGILWPNERAVNRNGYGDGNCRMGHGSKRFRVEQGYRLPDSAFCWRRPPGGKPEAARTPDAMGAPGAEH